MQLVELVDGPEGESVAVVEQIIVESAGSGKIGATALAPGGAIRRPLATHDWAAVRLRLPDVLEAITPEPERFSNAGRHWTALRFERQQVVSLWPPEPREGAPSLDALAVPESAHPRKRRKGAGRPKPEWYPALKTMVERHGKARSDAYANGKVPLEWPLAARFASMLRQKGFEAKDNTVGRHVTDIRRTISE